MTARCGICGAIGFEAELQSKWTDSQGNKVDNFGDLCCCKGKVRGIVDYQLGSELEHLYTDKSDPTAKHFRENARVYNNSMAMSSLACEKGWRTRVHNNKMEAMLTAQGQLLRRIGPLIPRENERPKCIQAYFYGDDQATAFRMKNCRVQIPQREKATYTQVFKQLHNIMVGAGNKYLDSFMGVKEYVENNLKDKVWDVRLSINANASVDESIH